MREWLSSQRHVALAIDGGDLLAAGVPEGPEVGARLSAALRRKREGALPTREQELRYALEDEACGERVSAMRLEAELPGGGVYFSDRPDGNMSSVGGEGHEQGAANRDALRERLGLRRLARGYQVHGTFVRTVATMPEREAQRGELVQADGQATPIRGLGAMVLAADCLPVAIGGEGAVAMVHAGWRGLAAGALEHGVEALRALAAGPLEAVLGPCAHGCCYEVGPEVHAALGTGVQARAKVDLPSLARERLLAAGVGSVRSLGGCTICQQRFFSYRREGERAGRQAGVAWLS